MKTVLKTGVIAAALIGAIAMTATPSEARWRHGGAAAAGFVGGLAVGAIAANAYNNNYYGPGYGYGYAPGYAYYGGPAYAYDGYAYDTGPAYYGSYAYAPARTYRSNRASTNYNTARDYYNNESLMSR
jgi:hypothetical protein